ncbi:phosphocarrier protein HPr [Candidatus Endobugula sertula]|uniref:Phosphocarrier protein HPr n=1 Tax=Candidatus Endobugula sertula TaxID=62101 RepID=A0A1D2QQM6_9GAMM|nr:phosphocarrier protein HPr [Candidatus Endobugula sertula]
MIRQSLTIINKLGLHARAAAKLAALAGRYSSSIQVSIDTKTVDCKSVISLMLLAASKGTNIEIIVEGCDENTAMEAIEQLINDRFDEAE